MGKITRLITGGVQYNEVGVGLCEFFFCYETLDAQSSLLSNSKIQLLCYETLDWFPN